MATRKQVQDLLSRVYDDLNRPVPIKTDSFGAKTISQDTLKMGRTLMDAKKVLEDILIHGIDPV